MALSNVSDLRDGTYRVALDPPPHTAGEYEVTATLKAGARPGSFTATFLLGEST